VALAPLRQKAYDAQTAPRRVSRFTSRASPAGSLSAVAAQGHAARRRLSDRYN